MAFEAFLKLGEDIGGESVEQNHVGWIELLSWNIGLERSHQAFRLDSTRVQFTPFTVTKFIDSASAPLMTACTRALHIPEATIETGRFVTESIPYVKYVLRDCRIQQVNWTAVPAGNADRPCEEVSIIYESIELSHTFIDTNHGPGGDFESQWNLAEAAPDS